MGWIAWDLDGTLAQWGTKDPHSRYIHYDIARIGAPIAPMIARLKAQLDQGQDCRIFTARVGPVTEEEARTALERVDRERAATTPVPHLDWLNYQRTLIETWCQEHVGRTLPITATKDLHMYQLYDDRCVQVVSNEGQTLQDLYTTALGKIATLEDEIRELRLLGTTSEDV